MDKSSAGPSESGSITEQVMAIRTINVNFFIFKTPETLIAIDAGYGKSLILAQLRRQGIDSKRVSALFLTHSDMDHAGGLSLFPQARLYLSRAEVPMISGEKPRFFGLTHNAPIGRPYETLKDGDVVSIGATRIRAISATGHTIGSMAYLFDESILFSGDVFSLKDGGVYPTRKFLNMDTGQDIESIRKLAKLENVLMAFTAHTGYTKDYPAAMKAWR